MSVLFLYDAILWIGIVRIGMLEIILDQEWLQVEKGFVVLAEGLIIFLSLDDWGFRCESSFSFAYDITFPFFGLIVEYI